MSPLRLSSVNIAIIAIAISYILYKYLTRNFDYWKNRNVPYLKPWPLFGNLFEVFALRTSIGHFLAKRYDEFKTPYFGMYVLNKPHLVIRSPQLIKSILCQDFANFPNRTLFCDETLDSITAKHLFLAQNGEWKFMRTKITPAFSLGKVKIMVDLMSEIGEDLVTYLAKNEEEEAIDAKETCAKYVTELVATCAFGIKANCFVHEDAIFRVIGRKMFDGHWKTMIRQICYFVAPNIVQLFKMPFLDPMVTDFMREFVWKSIEDRERSRIVRNDVIDMMIKIRSQNTPEDEFQFDGDRIVAQAGQFFSAGFETVSATMSFTLYELALYPKIQNKLRIEIKAALAQHGFTYEALQEMKYLNMVIHETLRKYPALPFLDRMCQKDFKLPGGDLVIEKGTPVYIPMLGLQYDPEYFPDSDRFDPERFSEHNKKKIPDFAYIPFGGGPRNCIGQQFGLVASKLGLAHVLSEFQVERTRTTPVPIKFECTGFLLASTVGLPVKFRRVKIP